MRERERSSGRQWERENAITTRKWETMADLEWLIPSTLLTQRVFGSNPASLTAPCPENNRQGQCLISTVCRNKLGKKKAFHEKRRLEFVCCICTLFYEKLIGMHCLCTMHIAHCTMHIAQCTMHIAHCTLHIAHCTMHNAQCTCTMHNAQCTLHIAHAQ